TTKRLTPVRRALPHLEKAMRLSDLDGLTIWHEARLQEEDVDNVHSMATADFVDLILSTRLPPQRIIEWMDQAILFSRIGGETPEITQMRRSALAKYGIVTATTVLAAERRKNIPDDVTIALNTVDRVKLLAWLSTIADAVRTSSNLSLVCAWKNI